jgi:hypothetical protein
MLGQGTGIDCIGFETHCYTSTAGIARGNGRTDSSSCIAIAGACLGAVDADAMSCVVRCDCPSVRALACAWQRLLLQDVGGGRLYFARIF